MWLRLLAILPNSIVSLAVEPGLYSQSCTGFGPGLGTGDFIGVTYGQAVASLDIMFPILRGLPEN